MGVSFRGWVNTIDTTPLNVYPGLTYPVLVSSPEADRAGLPVRR